MSVCQAFSIVPYMSVTKAQKVLAIIIIVVLKSNGKIFWLVYIKIYKQNTKYINKTFIEPFCTSDHLLGVYLLITDLILV